MTICFKKKGKNILEVHIISHNNEFSSYTLNIIDLVPVIFKIMKLVPGVNQMLVNR